MTIGQTIKKLRTQRKFTQYELAALAGVSHASISHWEKGYKCPSLANALRLAEAFNIPFEEFVKDMEV